MLSITPYCLRKRQRGDVCLWGWYREIEEETDSVCEREREWESMQERDVKAAAALENTFKCRTFLLWSTCLRIYICLERFSRCIPLLFLCNFIMIKYMFTSLSPGGTRYTLTYFIKRLSCHRWGSWILQAGFSENQFNNASRIRFSNKQPYEIF